MSRKFKEVNTSCVVGNKNRYLRKIVLMRELQGSVKYSVLIMRNERYDFFHLPEEFHRQHQTCEFLLYQIEDFILKDSFNGLKSQTLQLTNKLDIFTTEHIFDYLIRVCEVEKHNELITSNILNAIISDTCQFLQIALFSSLQQRLTVAFSLIRKPFVYNLIIILRLILTDDFLDRYNKEDGFDTTYLPKDELIKLINDSENLLLTKSIKACDIYDFIFNPALSDSLLNISNKALHPSTNRNKDNKTEIQNINFVFSSYENIRTQWSYFYKRLPYLLLYLNEILEVIVFSHLKLDSKIYTERLTERVNFFKLNNSMLT